MRVLIAGCGYVGTALGLRLAAEGHEVFGLRRAPGGLPAPIVPVAADLADRAGLGELLPAEIDWVAYTAAAGGFDPARYRAAYVDGPRNLIAALASRPIPPSRFVFVSSTGVYHQRDGSFVDEDSPAVPEEFSGQLLLEGERQVLASSFPAVVIRLGGIYGPGRTRLIESVRAGTARIRGGAPVYTNRIHRDDAAGAIANLLAAPAPAPLYLGVDDEPAAEADVLDWLADRLGVPRPPVDADIPRDRLEQRGNKRCSNARLRASGYQFLYPTFREGYAALVIPPT